MKGWATRSFGERIFNHHRKMGTAGSSELRARFHYGKKDFFLGGHPLWQMFRSGYQMTKRPYVLGGLFLLAGYVWYWITGHRRAVSPELLRFHRGEQRARLKRLIPERLGFKRQLDDADHLESYRK
jgi:hypothetical protein